LFFLLTAGHFPFSPAFTSLRCLARRRPFPQNRRMEDEILLAFFFSSLARKKLGRGFPFFFSSFSNFKNGLRTIRLFSPPFLQPKSVDQIVPPFSRQGRSLFSPPFLVESARKNCFSGVLKTVGRATFFLPFFPLYGRYRTYPL